MSQPIDTHDTSPKTLLLFLGMLVFIAFYGTLLCGLWTVHFSMRDVIRDGTQTTALLENKYIDDNNQHWFIYRFTTRLEDTYVSSIDVPVALYQQYQIGDTLSMRYLLESPSLNALDILQSEIRADVWGMIRLSIIVIGISLLIAFIWLRQISLRQMWRTLHPDT